MSLKNGLLVCFALILAAGCSASTTTEALQTSSNSGSAITAAELTQDEYPMPADLPANATHEEACNYAWRMFIAASQLAGTNRGQASTSSSFVDSGSQSTQSGPLVWESYYHRSEAYPFYTGDVSNKPKPVSTTSTLPTYYMFQGKKKDPTAFTISPPTAQWVNLDENNEIGQNSLFFPISGGNAQVLFMAKVNAAELSYVWPKGRIVNSDGTTSPPLYFPTSGYGTIEVKSAWRLASQVSDRSRYHIAPATYYQDTGQTDSNGDEILEATTAEFALIALHIIRKTPNYPQFIFSTFEQIDAITDASGAATNLFYQPSYTNVQYYDAITLPGQAVPTTLSSDQNPSATYSGAATSIKATSGTTTNSTTALPTGSVPASTNVGQPKTITLDAINVNNNVHGFLPDGSIWKYYALKGVQSLDVFTDNFTTTPATTKPDYYLANIVVESSQPGVQLFKGGPPGPNTVNDVPTLTPSLATLNVTHPSNQTGTQVPNYDIGGCMGCHGVAQSQGFDFSFLSSALGEIGTTKATGFKPEALLSEGANVQLETFRSLRRLGAREDN